MPKKANFAELKEYLKELLISLGGRCSVKELGGSLNVASQFPVDYKDYGASNFNQLLHHMRDVFDVFKEGSELYVILKSDDVQSKARSNVLQQTSFLSALNSLSTSPDDIPLQMPKLIRACDLKWDRHEEEKITSLTTSSIKMLKPSEFLAKYKDRAGQSSPSNMSVTSSDFFVLDKIPTSTPIQSEIESSQDEESDLDETLVSENALSHISQPVVVTKNSGSHDFFRQLPKRSFKFPDYASTSSVLSRTQNKHLEASESDLETILSEDETETEHPYRLLNCQDSSTEELDESIFEQQKAIDASEPDQESIAMEQMTDDDDSGSSKCSFDSVTKDYSTSEMAEKDDTCLTQNETLLADDPKAYIATLPVDDPFFFINAPTVIRDSELKLDYQIIPDGEINIHITEVFSPVHFYFHYEYDVEPLMLAIQEDYTKMNRDTFVISDQNIKPGLLVASYLSYFKKWHRAIVINAPNTKGEVRLNFIDYGTVATVKKENVKFLLEKYLHYPKMANRGRFVNLKPPNQEPMWPAKQVEKFLLKIGNKELKANIVSRNEADHVYELEIFLKKENLRDMLIELHIADPFELRPCSIYPSCYYFPTFDMLEKEFPTFHEKSELNSKGIDFDLLLETNFLNGINRSQVLRNPKLLRLLGKDEYKDLRHLYFSNPKKQFL